MREGVLFHDADDAQRVHLAREQLGRVARGVWNVTTPPGVPFSHCCSSSNCSSSASPSHAVPSHWGSQPTEERLLLWPEPHFAGAEAIGRFSLFKGIAPSSQLAKDRSLGWPTILIKCKQI